MRRHDGIVFGIFLGWVVTLGVARLVEGTWFPGGAFAVYSALVLFAVSMLALDDGCHDRPESCWAVPDRIAGFVGLAYLAGGLALEILG